MEPIITATSFAAIVGLICNFKQERRARSEDEYKEFTEWLGSKRHGEIQDLLAANLGLSQTVSSLLNEHNDVLLEKLNILEEVMLKVGARVEGLNGIAKHFETRNEISNQAIKITKSVCEIDGGGVLCLESGIQQLLYVNPRNISIEIEEPQYIDSDLKCLVEIGCLQNFERLPNGGKLYPVERYAMKFIKNIATEV